MGDERKPSLTRLLGSKNAADFNVLLTNELKLSEIIVENCNSALVAFVEHLKIKLQPHKEFKEIIIGGSLGTRTEINSEDDVDATLHVMYDFGSNDVVQCMTSFKENLSQHMRDLESYITEYGSSIEIDDLEKSKISCTLAIPHCPIDIELEIIPALDWDVKNEESRQTLYHEMIMNAGDRRLYASSLCRLQVDFIKDLNNTRLLNLIRLVKFWLLRAFSVDEEKFRLPSIYSLQLLVISLWESAGKPETFKPSAGFRAVMETLRQYNDLYITWSVYYTKDLMKRTLVNQRKPIIMDPCDPTKNYASECNCWNNVATVAIATLGKPIIQDLRHNPRWQ